MSKITRTTRQIIEEVIINHASKAGIDPSAWLISAVCEKKEREA